MFTNKKHNKNLFSRWSSTNPETNISASKLKECLVHDGKLLTDKIIKNLKMQSTRNKQLMLAYACCSLMSFTINTFSDGVKSYHIGKEARYRSKRHYSRDERKEDDMRHIKKGCYANCHVNAIKSLVFPVYWLSNCIPTLVYLFADF